MYSSNTHVCVSYKTFIYNYVCHQCRLLVAQQLILHFCFRTVIFKYHPHGSSCKVFFFFLIYLFTFGCVGSSFLCEGFLQLWRVGATLHRGALASHYRSLSCCGAQAPDVQAQQLWLTGPVVPRHVGSSQTRAGTHVLCIGRQILNHCATREAPLARF